MNRFRAIWKRELTAAFLSPVAYVAMVVFLGATGLTFFTGAIRNEGRTDPLAVYLVGAAVIWLGLLIPVVTMRLFAEEKRSGTLESLMTAPVSEREVVLGKYAGALSFILIVALPAFAGAYILARISPAMSWAAVDKGALLGGVVIFLLLAAFFTALGLVISLTTSNQIISALCSLAAFWFGLLFGWFITVLPGGDLPIAHFLSATDQLDAFTRGLLDLRPIILFASGTVFFLFLAVRMLESRRWR